MTVSVELESEVYRVAQEYAEAKGLSVSDAIGEVFRRADPVADGIAPGRLRRNEHGYLVIAKDGHPIAAEMAEGLSEDPVEESVTPRRLVRDEYGVLVMAKTGRVITTEMVNEFLENELD